MDRRYWIVLCLGVAIGCGKGGSASTEKPDPERVQGGWRLVAGWGEGKPLTEAEVKKGYVAVKGNEFKMGQEGFPGKRLTFRIDPATNPKQITLSSDDTNLLGIYEFENEKWKIAFGKTRPRDYSPNEDTFVLVLQPGTVPDESAEKSAVPNAGKKPVENPDK